MDTKEFNKAIQKTIEEENKPANMLFLYFRQAWLCAHLAHKIRYLVLSFFITLAAIPTYTVVATHFRKHGYI